MEHKIDHRKENHAPIIQNIAGFYRCLLLVSICILLVSKLLGVSALNFIVLPFKIWLFYKE